jgi:major membrane immunogen (membrane-anchored lipoprotein)
MKHIVMIVAAAALLSACGERVQTGVAGKQDSPAYNGTGKAFVEKGWKQGDKTSWESQLKARGQNSQNEYSRTN